MLFHILLYFGYAKNARKHFHFQLSTLPVNVTKST